MRVVLNFISQQRWSQQFSTEIFLCCPLYTKFKLHLLPNSFSENHILWNLISGFELNYILFFKSIFLCLQKINIKINKHKELDYTVCPCYKKLLVGMYPHTIMRNYSLKSQKSRQISKNIFFNPIFSNPEIIHVV